MIHLIAQFPLVKNEINQEVKLFLKIKEGSQQLQRTRQGKLHVFCSQQSEKCLQRHQSRKKTDERFARNFKRGGGRKK